MKKLYFSFALVIIAIAGNLSAQDFEWAKNIGGTGLAVTEGYAITTDATGNSYITGSFSGDTCKMDNLFVINAGPNHLTDIFIAKYDVSGNVLWARSAGGIGTDIGNGISFDAMGNVYVTGTFQNTAFFGTTSVTAVNNNDIFLAKYNASGILQWVVRGGGVNQEESNGISVDDDGNSYITGVFWGTADFGGISYTAISGNNADIFIAKYNTSGGLEWLEQVGGIGLGGQWSLQQGRAISVEPSGKNVYVTGWFLGIVTWGSFTHTSNNFANGGERNLFIAKYDSSGVAQWVQPIGAYQINLSTHPESHAIDAYGGNVYLTGFVPGALIFNSDTIVIDTASSPFTWHYDIFLAKYDTSGTFIWVKKPGGSDSDHGNGLSVYSSGDVYLTGYFSNFATFGNHTIGPVTNHAYVVKYDQAGNALWVKNGTGAFGGIAHGISLDASGNAYLVGSFLVDATFGNTTIMSDAGQDAFITKCNISLTGITEEYPSVKFKLFPNPSTGIFNIYFSNMAIGKTQINIYNILGETVYREQILAKEKNFIQQFDITGFADGIYFLKLESAGKKYTQKLSLHR